MRALAVFDGRLAIARTFNLTLHSISARRRANQPSLCIDPLLHESYWSAVEHATGGTTTHISIKMRITNLSDARLRLDLPRLAKPRVRRLTTSGVVIESHSGRLYDSDTGIAPRHVSNASFDIFIKR